MVSLPSWLANVPAQPILPPERYTFRMRRLTRVTAVCFCAIAFVLSGRLAAESAAGLRWTPPAGWKSAPAQPMRAATYTIAPAAGDSAAAECGVYFFGVGQGGSVDDNIERWKGQIQGPGGKPATAQVAKRKVRGLTVTTIDTSGEYSGMGGPMAGGRPVPGYRLLGAIVEGPSGNVFIKFAGPAKTIAANEQKFEQLLASLQRER
jgi:hypothetical protein